MKILMITPYLPYPLVSGGQIRTYNLLKNLSSKHEITLASFIRDEQEEKYVSKLSPFCKKVIVVSRRKAFSPINVILAALTPYPFLVSIYFDPFVKRRIQKELANGQYDLIHAETFYVMPNIPQTKIPIFLVEQVIEYLVYQRFVDSLPPWTIFVKPFLYFDVAKIKWWEKYYWQKARRLAAMSEEDRKFIRARNPLLKVDIVANGVDNEFFNKTQKQKPKSPTVLFVGNFKWLPNRDAAKFLIQKIWPHIKSQVKNAHLWIVGRNPTKDILKLSSPDITIDANVSDIRSAYAKASVLLAPIRNGRGTKYKILEAMATKTPIVGTNLAIEGINIKNDREAFVAESAYDLAQKTVTVLKNPKIGDRLSEAAYNLVTKSYSWQKISDQLDKVYREVGEG